MNRRRLVATWVSGVAVAAVLAGLAGCKQSGAEFKVAPVKGKVTHQGQPVKGGSITFQPVGVEGAKAGVKGKPATGEVKDDGTFVLSTYGKGDGAVVGKHRVMYMPTIAGAQSYDEKPKPSPYAGLAPKEKEVEVKSGPNEIAIELVPSS
jgi:hypothetical protein